MTEFSSWDDFHRAGSGIVSEAFGYARSIDPADDDAVLKWAREYLPRILEHGQSAVVVAAHTRSVA